MLIARQCQYYKIAIAPYPAIGDGEWTNVESDVAIVESHNVIDAQ